jgi:predicted HAD superfamily hydrolase
VRALKQLAGAMVIHVKCVYIYAPRDEAEVEVAMTITKASIQFMTGLLEASEQN